MNSTAAAEDAHLLPRLCDFCRPRIHDLSKLGWKEKRDIRGNLFLEPEIILRSEPGNVFVLSPYNNSIEGARGGVRYGIFGDIKVEGIEASDKIVKVEFYRALPLPDGRPEKIEPTGCSFCDILTYSLVKARFGANKPWNYPFPIYNLQFHFKYALIVLEEGPHGVSLSAQRMLLKQIVVEYQPRISMAELVFPVGVLPGRRSAEVLNIQNEAIIPDLLDDANITKLKSWLGHCNPNTHPCCHNTDASPLFIRLLEIGSGNDEESVKLIETKDADLVYIALSYCWGAQSTSNKTLKTTKSSIREFLVEIPWSQLPPNFVTILQLAKRLGFRYVWIDSLCIIQDDLSDWNVQASQMDSIYRNARLTVVTASAVSPNDDIKLRQSAQEWKEIPWTFLPNPTLNGVFLLDAGGSGLDSHIGNRFADVALSRWNSRAWTFQERFLSKRLLYLGKHAAYWECLGKRLHESRLGNEEEWRSDDPPDFYTEFTESHFKSILFGTGFESSEPPTITAVLDMWLKILDTYTRRYLTFEEDNVAALAGLAKAFAKIINRIDPLCDTYYIGGVWRTDIQRCLLWHTEHHLDKTHAIDNVFIPSRDFLIPKSQGATWLWSCVAPSKDGPPRWDHDWILKFEVLDSTAYIGSGFEILRLETSPTAQDQFTCHNPQGTLRVRGRMKRVAVTISLVDPQFKLSSAARDRDFDIGLNQGRRSSMSSAWLHYCYWSQQDYDLIAADQLRVYVLIVAYGSKYPRASNSPETRYSGNPDCVYGLFLVPLIPDEEKGGNTSRRVGIFKDESFRSTNWDLPADSPMRYDFSGFRDTQFRTIQIV